MKSIEKIAYIVPSEAMMKSVQDILKEEISAGVIDVLMIDVSNVESEYRKLCDKGYSCIVARGGTFSDLLRSKPKAVLTALYIARIVMRNSAVRTIRSTDS